MDTVSVVSTVREVRVPDIGDFKDVPVIEVLIKAGDIVTKEAPLLVLETDKATLDVPSSLNGVIRELKLRVGDKVNQGSLIALLDTSPGEDSPPAPAPEIKSSVTVTEVPSSTPPAQAIQPQNPGFGIEPRRSVRASPSLRRIARELGVDLSRVPPSLPNGRLQRKDVERFVRDELTRAAASPQSASTPVQPRPKIDFARFGVIERRALSRVRTIAGANLTHNWTTIPHVTNFDEADITELEEFRVRLNHEYAKEGIKLTMLAFLIKASVAALQKYPDFNASLDGQEVVYKRYFHIGFAADTPNGLLVPVIRDADKKGLLQIAREVAELAQIAREGKLKPDHMQGGSFSISSLGGIGGTGFTPIINAPEVAILGAARADHKPKWEGTRFEPRLLLPLDLSWDHRVIDGAAAARFLVYLCALLADFRRALL
jgi:pyruvate dehydrogenase E2 component (dihydrolipoyllysine-residue acetyltransferase)